jgi:hypothetical protein
MIVVEAFAPTDFQTERHAWIRIIAVDLWYAAADPQVRED